MDYFPAFLDLKDRHCLLVGGGELAARKARLLLAAGARLTVVAPALGDSLAAQAAAGAISHHKRYFAAADLAGVWLVVCATNDAAAQAAVRLAADAAGVFCNCVDNGAASSFITPAIVDRSPIVMAISSGGAAPVLARMLRERCEAMLPVTLGPLAAMARRWRARVNKRLPGLPARRRFWEGFFRGRVASAAHARDMQSAGKLAAALLDDAATAAADRGEAWLVGAGPGDPGLLTLRALQVLQTADIVLHDRLVSPEVLAMARRDALLVAVGKVPGGSRNSQQNINAELIRLVAAGHRVCRLKGGDPFIFGRGGEEAEALAAAGLPCQVIPGITAAAGCAAYSGIPLTHRDAAQSVVLLTAHGSESIDRLDWPSLARDRQTLAVYMAVGRFPTLMARLIAHGRPASTPIAIVENGTRVEQRVVRGRLGQLVLLSQAHDIKAPAMLIIGDVAALGATRAGLDLLLHADTTAADSAIQKTANL